MAKFEVGDKVKFDLGEHHLTGYIIEHEDGDDDLCIDEMQAHPDDEWHCVSSVHYMDDATPFIYHFPASLMADEYDYEREAGHTDKAPKGIQPPTR